MDSAWAGRLLHVLVNVLFLLNAEHELSHTNKMQKILVLQIKMRSGYMIRYMYELAVATVALLGQRTWFTTCLTLC